MTAQACGCEQSIALLKARGHTVNDISDVSLVHAIQVEKDWLAGGTDRRGNGKASGY